MNKNQHFAAIKIDIVKSRTYEEREELQKKLIRVANYESNQRFSSIIVSDFVVTHGDEVQGLIKIGEELIDVANLFLDELYPVKIRIGIGLGTISTDLQPLAIGMDGPAFYNAKDAIDFAHKEKKVIVLRGSNQLEVQAINTIFDLMMSIRQEWNEMQYNVIKLTRKGYLQEEIGNKLKITQSTVSKNIRKAKWKVYLESEDTIRELLNNLNER